MRSSQRAHERFGLIPSADIVARKGSANHGHCDLRTMDLDRPFLWKRLPVICPINRARDRFCRLAGVLSELFLANVRNVAVWTD